MRVIYNDMLMRAAKQWEHGANGNSGGLCMIRADPSNPLNPCAIPPDAKASDEAHAIAQRYKLVGAVA